MAFHFDKLSENEYRTYTLTMWPRSGEQFTPKGGIIDWDNNIRLFYYGNGPYRSASNEYQFIFDFKGTVMNVNIGKKVEENDLYYSLLQIDGADSINIEDIKPFLREALRLFWERYYNSSKERIHIMF